MRRTLGSRILSMFMLLTIASLLGAGGMAVEYMSHLPKPGDRLVEGRIVKVEVKETTGDDNSPGHESFLTIEIVNTNTTVTTLVPGDWTNKPAFVEFYYSGDPTQQVFLQSQNTSSLQTALVFLLMAFLMFLPVIIVLMIRKKEKDFRHNEYEALVRKIK